MTRNEAMHRKEGDTSVRGKCLFSKAEFELKLCMLPDRIATSII